MGDCVLAEYSYTGDRNNYLSTLDYGNGGRIEYEYYNKGRLTKQIYISGDAVTYTYNNDGALAKVYDPITDISTKYYYDLTGRQRKYTESGADYSHSVGYEYDKRNNLTELVEDINGTERTTAYTYDEDNRIETVTTGDVTVAYDYDGFGRIATKTTKNGDTEILTERYTYTATNAATSAQIATHTVDIANGDSVTYSYTYDDNGNILSISHGSNTVSYVYDSANQLLRENNLEQEFTNTWEYDNAGNILNRKGYFYTAGELDEEDLVITFPYTYGDGNWGDLLTAYDGEEITYDEIGNPLTDGTWTYSWENGRQLMSMTRGSTKWNYTYSADGLRTKRTNGTTTYNYVYNGSQLSQMTVGADTLHFTYDANGRPTTLTYNGTLYYYVTNLQGDVIAILGNQGETVVSYTYDAWGNILSCTGSMADTLGTYNPLRYRGYVYDQETGLYYVSSRYYDPEIGRFISPDTTDVLTATPMGLTDKNLYAYCDNNPVVRVDHGGEFWNVVIGAAIGGAISLVSSIVSEAIEGDFSWKDVGQIAISTTIGALEGAAIALCPAASVAISAVASAADTAINGVIDGDSVGEIVTDSLVSGAIGAVAGSGGSEFVKGGKLINDAAGSVGNAIRKGVHPVVKKSARKTIKKAAKKIGREYVAGQIEDFAYGGIYEFTSFYTRSVVRRYRRR